MWSFCAKRAPKLAQNEVCQVSSTIITWNFSDFFHAVTQASRIKIDLHDFLRKSLFWCFLVITSDCFFEFCENSLHILFRIFVITVAKRLKIIGPNDFIFWKILYWLFWKKNKPIYWILRNFARSYNSIKAEKWVKLF